MPELCNLKNNRQQKITQKFLSLSNYQRNLVPNENLVAGVDEAGRGALAGPVVAACVILDLKKASIEINDSKKLSPQKREKVFEDIKKNAISFGVGFATKEEIEKLNIKNASLLAMKRSLANMQTKPNFILVDGMFPIETDISQKTVVNGDALCLSISAASIVAKVTRDRIMVKMKEKYPRYSFDLHKGYGTKKHFEEIVNHGPSDIHRPSFIRKIISNKGD